MSNEEPPRKDLEVKAVYLGEGIKDTIVVDGKHYAVYVEGNENLFFTGITIPPGQFAKNSLERIADREHYYPKEWKMTVSTDEDPKAEGGGK